MRVLGSGTLVFNELVLGAYKHACAEDRSVCSSVEQYTRTIIETLLEP